MRNLALLGCVASSYPTATNNYGDNAAVYPITGLIPLSKGAFLTDQPVGIQTKRKGASGLRRYISTWNGSSFVQDIVTQAHRNKHGNGLNIVVMNELVFDSPVGTYTDFLTGITLSDYFDTSLLSAGDKVFIDVVWYFRDFTRTLDATHPDLFLADVYEQNGNIIRTGVLNSDYTIKGFQPYIA